MRPPSGLVAEFGDLDSSAGTHETQVCNLRFVRPSRGVEVAEFRYHPTRGALMPTASSSSDGHSPRIGERLTLLKLGRYHYQVLVTNMPLQPLNLWRFYDDHAALNSSSGNSKGYALRSVPRCHFFADETYLGFASARLQTSSIGSSASVCPTSLQNATLQTLRHRIFLMPAPTASHRQPATFDLARKRSRRSGLETCAQQINKLKTVKTAFFTPDSGLVVTIACWFPSLSITNAFSFSMTRYHVAVSLLVKLEMI